MSRDHPGSKIAPMTTEAPPAPPETPPAAPPAPPEAPPAAPEPAKLTADQQAVVDAAMKDRLARERANAIKEHDAKLKEYFEREQMDAASKANADKADAEKAATEATSKATQRVVAADAKVALLSAGVDAKNIAAAVKLADLEGLDPDADDYDTKVTAAAKKVLDDLPALKTGAGTKTSASGGEFNADGKAKVWTRAEVAKLTTAEFDKHEAEITKQMQTIGLK